MAFSMWLLGNSVFNNKKNKKTKFLVMWWQPVWSRYANKTLKWT